MFMVALSVIVQVALPAKIPPLNENDPDPAVPVGATLQVPADKLGGLAIVIPAGILSIKEIPSSSPLLGFVN